MAPRCRSPLWPLLALLAACAPAPDRATAALEAALASSRDSLLTLACDPHQRTAWGQGAVPCGEAESRAAPGPGALRPARFEPQAVPSLPLPAGTPPVMAAELLGAGPEAVRRRLGEPALRRVEGPAEIWLYAGPACALDLVLYPGAGGLRVAHAAARAAGAESRTEAECLRELGRTPPGAAPAGRHA